MGTERDRRRVKSRVDELPEDQRARIEELLKDVTVGYQQIADAITAAGYPISKSSIHRYAARLDKALDKMDAAQAQVSALLKRVREGQDVESTEVATALLMDGLIRRLAGAEEEFETIPIAKAGTLITQIQRSATYKARMQQDHRKLIDGVRVNILAGIREAVQADPELLDKLAGIVNAAAEQEATRLAE